MESNEKIEHPLALKVMRLTRPVLHASYPVTCEPKDLPGSLFNFTLKNDVTTVPGLETLEVGQFLLGPQSFGSIYFGETFTCYVCVTNDSLDVVHNVILKADLQTSTQRLTLLEGSENVVLKSKQTLDEIVRHEVKEIGAHILICEVTYMNRLTFRKFFKFQVLKPLDVKTKLYTTELTEVYLEAQLQNIMVFPMCLQKVSLLSSDYFTVTDLNTVNDSSIYGDVNVIKNNAVRQYLYCLTPKTQQDFYNNKDDTLNVGILDIVWRSNLGEHGHLQTSALQTVSVTRGDLRLNLLKIPYIVFAEKPFKFMCSILNVSDRDMQIRIYFKETKEFIWCSRSGLVKYLAPGESIELPLQIILYNLGVQKIRGIQLKDVRTHQTYELECLAEVFVRRR